MRGILTMFRSFTTCRRNNMPDASRDATDVPKPVVLRAPSTQGLGPNQLKWLDDKFKFYNIHRLQAEAVTGRPGHQPKYNSED